MCGTKLQSELQLNKAKLSSSRLVHCLRISNHLLLLNGLLAALRCSLLLLKVPCGVLVVNTLFCLIQHFSHIMGPHGLYKLLFELFICCFFNDRFQITKSDHQTAYSPKGHCGTQTAQFRVKDHFNYRFMWSLYSLSINYSFGL